MAESFATEPKQGRVHRYRGPLAYLAAAGTVAASTVIQWLIDPYIGDSLIFGTYFAAVVVTAGYFGFWPAVFAIVLSVAAADWFFLAPRYSFIIGLDDTSAWLGILTFVLVGLTVAAFNEALQGSRQAAYSAARQLSVTVEHVQFLSEASKSVAALVDVESSMHRLARLCVPRFADWCLIYLVNEESGFQPITRAHRDQRQEPLLAELSSHYLANSHAPAITSRVLQSGEAEYLPEVSRSDLVAATGDGRHRELIETLAPGSAVILPLESLGRTIGVMELFRGKERAAFTPHEFEVAQELARRAATAIDNSRLYDELRNADRQKDDFLAMLAHELRNPLAAIDYAIQLAKISPEQAEHAGDIIHRQVRHLARLIDDLLDVSRITRGKIELQKEAIDACTIVIRAAGTARPIIEEHDHRFDVEVAPDKMPLWVDPTRAEQIVVNLLTNAAKYTPKGGEISLHAFRHDDEVVIKVKDTGIGIPKEMLPRIFELFTQVHPELDRAKGGLGIGLTVVRRLAEMHGGSVSATSKGLGQGTEFIVRLPLSMERAAGEVFPPQVALPPPGLRVMVVDDNVDTAASVSMLLEQAGCETKFVHDGRAALEAVDAFCPQIVLLDIGLPGIDGYEVARRLRAKPKHADLRLIAISGYGQAKDHERSTEAGFNHHLVKPVHFPSLLALLVG